MSASGVELLIRVGDEERPYGGELIELTDLGPSLAFRTNSTTPLDCRAAGGDITPPARRGDWYVWWPLGKGGKASRQRRFGHFHLEILAPARWTLRVALDSARLLTAGEFAEMVRALVRVNPNAPWERPTGSSAGASDTVLRSAHGPFRVGQPRDTVWAQLEREVQVARRRVAAPARELGAYRPGGRAHVQDARVMWNLDLDENQVVLSWAKCRESQLLVLERGLRETSAARRREIERCTADEARVGAAKPLRAKQDLEAHARHLEDLAAKAYDLRERIRRTVAPLAQLVPPGRWAMTPGIRRSPDLSLLASAHVDLHPELDPRYHAKVFELAFQKTSDIFERWAAVWFVEAIARCGFALVESQVQHFEGLKARASWRFQRGPVSVVFEYGKLVRPLPAPAALRGCAPIDLVAAAEIPDGASAEYWCTGKNPEPDYLLRVSVDGHGVAFAVGDAVLTDFRELHRDRGDASLHATLFDWLDGGLPGKARKVQVDYVRALCFGPVDGRLVRCAPLCSLVVTAPPPEGVSIPAWVPEHLNHLGVLHIDIKPDGEHWTNDRAVDRCRQLLDALTERARRRLDDLP